MWLAKLKNWHKDCLIRPRCVKYKVTDLVYLLNSWADKNKFYYTELHILQGKEENIKRFIKDFKKEKNIKKFEVTANHIMTLNVEPLKKQFYSVVFNPKIIYVKPVVQRSDGYEDWEIACWDKEPLLELMKIPTFDMKLKSIEKIKLANIFIPQIYPKLSPKQKEALELAVQEGYYEYPRNKDLEDLAKMSKVKRQTFNENLRRAEKKLVPFLTENMY